MTAVATPPDYQNLNRQAWGQGSNTSNGLPAMSAEDVSRMLMRKAPSRSNSSSSIASVSSGSSTVSNGSTGSSTSTLASNGDANSRKRPSRYLWPTSKAEPTAGISTARTQSMTSTSGQPAASAISALQNGSMPQSIGAASQNGARGPANDNTPILYLTPLNGTFERKTISVPTYPDVIKIGRQTNAKTIPTPYNGFFDSKVLSRSHAEIWADRNGQIWIRDVKSSNGTWINGQRLSQENKDSDPKELSDGDSLELGIDIVSEDQKTVVHHKVAARVEHAGFVSSSTLIDLNLPMNELDNANQHNQLVNQAMGHIRRKSGQGEMMPLRSQTGAQGMMQNNAPAQRSHIWLQPPNMEMAIKRLTAEYKLAQQQAHELQQSSQFLDTLLNATRSSNVVDHAPPRSPHDQRNSLILNNDSGMRSQFAVEPPNPPPQAPLPDKPNDLLATLAGMKRSSTEKPTLPNGQTMFHNMDAGAATQIANLSEALAAARLDYDTQSKRLREMENMLVEERMKRENAEARAQRLEKRGKSVDTVIANNLLTSQNSKDDISPSTPIEDEATSEIGRKPSAQSATERLQQRLDMLLAEFQEVKQSAERWKREKEQAEKERDAARTEKIGLMDMVAQLRKEERERQAKTSRKQEKHKQRAENESNDGIADPEEPELQDEDDESSAVDAKTIKSQRVPHINGSLASSLIRSHDHGGGTTTKRGEGHLVQATPYLSAMSVVLVGVAIMAMINKMSNGEK